MRLRHLVPVVGVAALSGSAIALAAHPKADPATVPTGFFTAHSQVNNVPVDDVRRIIRNRRLDAFIEHARLAPGAATRFHTHPGPVLVMVAAGRLTNEQPVAGACRRTTYVRDRGFVARGPRRPHRLIAGADGADYYLVYLAPRRTGPVQTEVAAPRAC